MSHEGDEKKPFELRINENFAKKFTHNKKRQELERLTSKYGDNPDAEKMAEESSSSSSMDELDNRDLNLNDPDFINVLTLIKTNNKKIYNKDTIFFEESNEPIDSKCTTNNSKRNRPIFLKDYQYQQAMEEESKVDTDSTLNDDEHYVGTGESNFEKKLKQSIIETTKIDHQNGNSDDNNINNNDNNNNDNDDEFFFPSKAPKYAKLINEETDTGKLKKALDHEQMDEKIINLMKGNEITLKTLNKESIKSGSQRVKIDNDSDDENTTIAPIAHDGLSARRKDDRRIRKRNEKKLRKKEDKMNMLNEIKQLKSLKKDNNTEKIDKIKKIAGIHNATNNNQIDISTLMDEDFDEQKYDQMMQKLFNDDYYEDNNDINEAEIKPLSCIDADEGRNELGEFLLNGDDDDDDNHPLKLTKQMKKRLRKEEKKLKKIEKSTIKDQQDNDPLDKFAYRQTFANDFGLTSEEILLCDDKELNQWCNLKKCIRYKEDEEEIAEYAIYAKKAKKTTKKSKILQSIQEALKETNEAEEQ